MNESVISQKFLILSQTKSKLEQTAAAQLKDVVVYSGAGLQPLSLKSGQNLYLEVFEMMTQDELDVWVNELLEQKNDS